MPLTSLPAYGKRRRTFTVGPAPKRRRVVSVSSFYGRSSGSKPGEQKFHDLDIDDAIVAAAGAIAEDSAVVIAQGNTESQRIGRKLTIRRIHWKYDISMPQAANAADPPAGDIVRIILYQDKQTNKATAAITDVLESADYQSFYNLANTGRFRILMDRSHATVQQLAQTDGTNTAAYALTPKNYTFNKVCAIPIEYDNSSTDGAITSQTSNNIGVITISRSGVAGFFSKMRLRYSDQ